MNAYKKIKTKNWQIETTKLFLVNYFKIMYLCCDILAH